MKEYTIHPVADIFPMMNEAEYKDLVQDIRDKGLLEPIWLYQEQIIDGRNRFKACQEAGVTPVFRNYEGSGSLTEFVVSLNLRRRHLSSEQKAIVGIKMLPHLEEEAKQRQIRKPNSVTEKIPEQNGGESRNRAAAMVNVNPHYISDAKKIQEKAPELINRMASGEFKIAEAKQVAVLSADTRKMILDSVDNKEYKTVSETIRQITIVEKAKTPDFPKDKYRCIVIDPPWPMEKLNREYCPEQGHHLNYPIMSLKEIAAIPIPDLAYSDGCHVYLWVTQKYLPAGLELFKTWGVKYECVLTWVKPNGFTPFSWMYNTEHVLFGRIGSLQILKMGIKIGFEAATSGHSVKPEKFFEMVTGASAEPRIELFARKKREGFTVWGNEVIQNE